MNPIEILLVVVAVLLLAWLAFVMFSPVDDEAAGVLLGPETLSLDDARARAGGFQPPSPWPARHFISACMYCHHVTRSDSHPVRVGDELRVSHGICDSCMAKKHPEVAHIPAQLAHA